jgi:hypothetical protein
LTNGKVQTNVQERIISQGAPNLEGRFKAKDGIQGGARQAQHEQLKSDLAGAQD